MTAVDAISPPPGMDSESWEWLKLCAARFIRDKHRDLTPKSQHIGTAERDRITWREWWERKFNDDYAKFIRANWAYFKPTEQTHHEPASQ